MASAVLPSRNEHYWSELDGNSRQFSSNPNFNGRLKTNPNHSGQRNPIYNPNFGLNRQISDHTVKSDLLPNNVPSPRLPPLPPKKVIDDAPNASRNELPVMSKDLFRREHVTFHLSSYSKGELKELKMRLISELEQVRALLTQIETRSLDGGRGFLGPRFSLPVVETNLKKWDPPTGERVPKARTTGFVAGNGKDNHKFGSHKRALASVGGRETKRLMVAATGAKALNHRSMMNKCKHILTNLMTQRYGYVFNKPVDVVGLKLYDYHDVIKHPMDFGTIMTKLSKRGYKSPLDFAADVRLTFANAMAYNARGSHVHNIAKTMLLSFEKSFGREFQQSESQKQKLLALKRNQNVSRVSQGSPVMMPKEVEEKLERSSAIEPILVSKPSCQKEQATLPRPSQCKKGKLPKPKTKDPNKRKMAADEKAELVLNLERMPQEKMRQVLQIVRKRNSKSTLEDDEVEIEIDALDNETLWDLDRFVCNNRKKAVIKMKRPEFHYDSIKLLLEDPKPKSSGTEPYQELAMENDKKGDTGEEDVDIGEDTPPNEFPPVKIEKDPVDANSGSSSSSSSSSSGDGSSSSDSDSGSTTSESDSDEDDVHSLVMKGH